MPLGMSAQLSLLLLSFTATPTALLALQQGTGLTVECGSSSHSQGAFKLGSESMMLEGLACSAMAVAIPGLTQLTCTSYTVLSYPVLSCCDVSCRVVSCPVLSCLVVSCLVASSIMLAWHGMACHGEECPASHTLIHSWQKYLPISTFHCWEHLTFLVCCISSPYNLHLSWQRFLFRFIGWKDCLENNEYYATIKPKIVNR